MSDINLIISATDAATPVLKRVNKQVDKFTRKSKKATASGLRMGSMMKMAGAAALAAGLAKVASSTVRTITQFDSLKAMLKTVTGSADGALVAFEQIKKFTAETPFQLAEVTNAFSILKRNGLDTTTESLTAFGNIAAANGKTFEQFAEALGDAVTGEFERMKEFGIKVKKEGDKMVAFMGSTQIGVSDSAEGIIEVFKKLGEEGGRYATGLADQAATIGGKWANLKDAMAETAYNMGAGGLKTVLIEVTEGLTDMFRGTGDLANMLGAGLGAAIRTVMMWFSKMGEIVSVVFNGISTAASWVGGMIKDPIKDAVNTISGYFPMIWENFKLAWEKISTWYKGWTNDWTNSLEVFFKNTKAIVSNLPDLFSKAWEEISRVVPKFAKALVKQVINLGETFYENIKIAVRNAPEAFNLAWEAIVKGVPLFGKALILQIKNVGEFLITNVTEIVTNLPQMFNRAWEAISQSVTNFGTAIIDQFDAIGNSVKMAWDAIWSDEISMEDAWALLSKNQFTSDKFKLDLTPLVGVNFVELENKFKGLDLELPPATFESFKKLNNLFEGEDFSMDIGLDNILLKAEEVARIMNQDRVGEFLSKEWVQDAIGGLKKIGDAAQYVNPVGIFQNFMAEYDKLLAEGIAEQEALALAIERTKKAEEALAATRATAVVPTIKKEKVELSRLQKTYQDLVKSLTDKTELDKIHLTMLPMINNAYAEGILTLGEYSDALNQINSSYAPMEVTAFRTIDAIKQGFAGMADSIGDTFYDVFTGVTSAFDGLKSIAKMVFQMVAKILIQTLIVKPLMAMMGIPGFAQGGLATGGRPAIVGENGPELIVPSGNSRVYSNSQTQGMLGGSGSEPLTVNFNLNAVSTRDGVEFLIDNKNIITNVIQDAYNTRGRAGPLG